jgi:hypothetical protein
MGPGEIKTIEATERGLEIDWRGLRVLPRGTAYGVSVFPVRREAILLLTLWLLLLRPGVTVRRAVVCAVLLGLSLALLHYAGGSQAGPRLAAQWLGFALFAAGLLVALLGRAKVPTSSHPSLLTCSEER